MNDLLGRRVRLLNNHGCPAIDPCIALNYWALADTVEVQDALGSHWFVKTSEVSFA